MANTEQFVTQGPPMRTGAMDGIYLRDSQTAFDNAIAKGMLDDDLAHDFMYMYSHEGSDYFKHRDTRQYYVV
jgi:hypothetical protein